MIVRIFLLGEDGFSPHPDYLGQPNYPVRMHKGYCMPGVYYHRFLKFYRKLKD